MFGYTLLECTSQKMATCNQGYKCEFMDSVPEDFYCKKCTLVARRLIFTSCCEETFCYTCIVDSKNQDKPCPVCGIQEFSIMEIKRYQNNVKQLQVYCNMKERGCVWSGTLDQLDSHLDPDLDNCQYVDIKCPLNCPLAIPKNKVEQHVAQECLKKPHICQHCGFKATYEEVVDTHLPECKYVALQCPNMCGVSCEREVMEDHMKICRLEEVECEFKGVGCEDRFIRKDQEEHARDNSLQHLTLTATLAVESRAQLELKLQEQMIEVKNLNKEQEKKIMDQEKKLGEQEKKLEEQERKLEEQEKNMIEFKAILSDTVEVHKLLKQELQESKHMVSHCTNYLLLKRKFEMQNFSKEKASNKVREWRSPVMYSHLFGYKFCIGVDANGYGSGRGKAIDVNIRSLPGEFDDKLKWPAEGQITIELINQQGGENAEGTTKFSWRKSRFLISINRNCDGFIEHSSTDPFLVNDTLCFHIIDIK